MSLTDAVLAPIDATERRRRFRDVFDGEFDYVWTTLRRLGVHDRDLEDVAQDVFVHVYRRLDAYDPSRPLRPWLFAFALRCASDWRRLARHRIEALRDPDKHAAPTLAADEAIARGEDQDLILAALDCLPVERRAVLVMYEFDDVPMKCIAESLGVALFTAYSRLRIARQEFTGAVRRLRAHRGEP